MTINMTIWGTIYCENCHTAIVDYKIDKLAAAQPDDFISSSTFRYSDGTPGPESGSLIACGKCNNDYQGGIRKEWLKLRVRQTPKEWDTDNNE